MRIRIWPILCLGFGALIAVIALSGWLALVRSRSTYNRISGLYAAEHDFQRALGGVRFDIAQSAILLRDFLLDPNLKSDGARSEVDRLSQSTQDHMRELERLIPAPQAKNLRVLREQTRAYWSSLQPLLTATARDRSRQSYSLIQAQILPRREAALKMVNEIEELSYEAFQQRKLEIDSRNEGLAFYLGRSMGIAVLIALCVAGVSVFRTHTLERSSDLQHRKVLAAEDELRKLSQQLVRTQEDERRALSRELHDQVGQVLTALRMALGNVEMATDGGDPRVTGELDLAKRLAGQALRSTRDLAMGLRPTMLDDLGLGAALEWYARQHSKLYGVPISLEIQARLDRLTDAQSTCLYRIVQESLNNSAKYAEAQNVRVTLASSPDGLLLDIVDDGRGFELDRGMTAGLGILGMRERVTQLGGTLSIESKPQQGTRISARFPVLEPVTA